VDTGSAIGRFSDMPSFKTDPDPALWMRNYSDPCKKWQNFPSKELGTGTGITGKYNMKRFKMCMYGTFISYHMLFIVFTYLVRNPDLHSECIFWSASKIMCLKNLVLKVCKTCKPVRPYVRLFDVTERTNRFRHNTRRRCYICGSGLLDTIVHFGERGSIAWPINWNGASRAAEKADMILCLGSSLKVNK
jgi:hypothetical protein